MGSDWRSSIVQFDGEVDPNELIAHPANARIHPDRQVEALRGSLERVGWVDAVKVNTRTGRIVDGHARVEEALASGAKVPVLWVDLSEDDERYVLATLDPIGALAEYDSEVLADLLSDVDLNSETLGAWLDDHLNLAAGPPDIDALADDYEPPKPSNTEPADLTLKDVSPDGLTRWEEFRVDFVSDDAALRALLDR